MGIFDKKKKSKDDFDSPVEQIDLSAPSTASGSLPKDDDDYEEVVASPAPTGASKGSSGPAKTAAQPAVAAPPAAAAPAKKPMAGYGIDDAIVLMRTLPTDNVELVVQVVKHTLESAKIDIATIIDDATGKVDRIESRVTVLRAAIADLEREIQTRRDEIDKLEADRRETTRVKERLLLAQKLTGERQRPGSVSSHPTPAPAPAPLAGPGPTAAGAENSGPLPGLRAPRTTGEVSAARERPLTMQPPAAGGSPDASSPKK